MALSRHNDLSENKTFPKQIRPHSQVALLSREKCMFGMTLFEIGSRPTDTWGLFRTYWGWTLFQLITHLLTPGSFETKLHTQSFMSEIHNSFFFSTSYYEETSVKIANFHKVPVPMSTRVYCVSYLFENDGLHVITDDVECIPCTSSVKKIESHHKGVIVKHHKHGINLRYTTVHIKT